MSAAQTWTRIKNASLKAYEENVVVFIGAAGIALTGVAKLISANTERKNSKVYRKEVDRRVRKDQRNRP